MFEVPEVELSLFYHDHRPAGSLRIKLRPNEKLTSGPHPLLDCRNDPESSKGCEPIQLLELTEYWFEIRLTYPAECVTCDKPEVLDADNRSGLTGRLKPGLYTGCLSLRLTVDGKPLEPVELEVRSKKLNYLTDYREMLNDITEALSDLALERFAPSEHKFTPDPGKDASTLYQRFAFLQSLIAGQAFQSALRRIVSRPYSAWIEMEEIRRPGQGVSLSSRTLRSLTGPGPRVEYPGYCILGSVPKNIYNRRTEATVDSIPNQFVKFALIRWRDVVADIHAALVEYDHSETRKRGLNETRVVLDELEAVLHEELFREVDSLTHFPAANQVLQKQEGYRDVFRAYVQFEVAAQLQWQGGEDVYGAGQKDVATLYEYWVFLQLVRIVSDLCHQTPDFGRLITESPDGLSIDLQHGYTQCVRGLVLSRGRNLAVELWFNHRFSGRRVSQDFKGVKLDSDKSWTRPMQPDYSIKISPAPIEGAGFEPIWVHFDAKYRIEHLREDFWQQTENDAEDQELLNAERTGERKGRAKRDDIIKMHAYRDAIRRSAGAYILYPGAEARAERATQFHEILPGLGAFALRPTASGPEGIVQVANFLKEIIGHVASQISQHERSRFWSGKIFGAAPILSSSTLAAPFLNKPAADTKVLLGYVKNAAHLDWILARSTYNLRGDPRRRGYIDAEALDCDLTALYGHELGDKVWLFALDGKIEIRTDDDLRNAHYPEPRGTRYHCLGLLPLKGTDQYEHWLYSGVIALLDQMKGHGVGEPEVVTWLDLALAAGSSRDGQSSRP